MGIRGSTDPGVCARSGFGSPDFLLEGWQCGLSVYEDSVQIGTLQQLILNFNPSQTSLSKKRAGDGVERWILLISFTGKFRNDFSFRVANQYL